MTESPKDGERAITLDRPRTLRMDFNALAKAEEMLGKDLMDPDTWKRMRASEYRALAFACLVHEDASLTLEAVGAMLTPSKAAEMVRALIELYTAAPSTTAPEEEAEPRPTASAGAHDGH
jgi:hypothetical protein